MRWRGLSGEHGCADVGADKRNGRRRRATAGAAACFTALLIVVISSAMAADTVIDFEGIPTSGAGLDNALQSRGVQFGTAGQLGLATSHANYCGDNGDLVTHGSNHALPTRDSCGQGEFPRGVAFTMRFTQPHQKVAMRLTAGNYTLTAYDASKQQVQKITATGNGLAGAKVQITAPTASIVYLDVFEPSSLTPEEMDDLTLDNPPTATPTPTATATSTATATAIGTATATATPGGSDFAALGAPTTEPPLDADGDGLDPTVDRCLDTPPGQAALQRGCSAMQLVREPRLVTEDALDDLRGAVAGLATSKLSRRFLAKPARQLASSRSALLQVGAEIGELDFCGAAKAAGTARRKVQRGAAAVRAGTRAAGRLISRRTVVDAFRNPKRHGDVDGDLFARSLIEIQAGETDEALRGAGRLAALAKKLCRNAKASTVQGTIASLDGHGIAVLDNGAKVALSALDQPLGLGQPFQATGKSVDGITLADVVTSPPPTKVLAKPCLVPQVAPYRYGPYAPEMLPLAGFTYDGGTLLMEPDTGFGVVAESCPQAPSPDKSYLYELEVRLSAQDGYQQTAAYLEPGEANAYLPISPTKGAKYTITFRELRATCPRGGGTCSEAVQIGEAVERPVAILGPIGLVDLEEDVFEVVDRKSTKGSFDTTTVEGARSLFLENPYPIALGYGESGGSSTFPDRVVVGKGSSVAVHAGSWPHPLKSPQVFGLRNGSPYLYSANSTRVVTDRLASCGNKQTFFDIPWRVKAFPVSQGSFTGPTHGGAWAWDFPMPVGTKLYAGRGGEVIKVTEHNTANAFEVGEQKYGEKVLDENGNYTLKKLTDAEEKELQKLAPPNEIIIRHQDGSIANYYHLEKDGALRYVGERVRRGELIARSGNVGFSTGPHLHLHLAVSDEGGSANARGEFLLRGKQGASENGKFETQLCGDPKFGEWWKSLFLPPIPGAS